MRQRQHGRWIALVVALSFVLYLGLAQKCFGASGCEIRGYPILVVNGVEYPGENIGEPDNEDGFAEDTLEIFLADSLTVSIIVSLLDSANCDCDTADAQTWSFGVQWTVKDPFPAVERLEADYTLVVGIDATCPDTIVIGEVGFERAGLGGEWSLSTGAYIKAGLEVVDGEGGIVAFPALGEIIVPVTVNPNIVIPGTRTLLRN